MGDIIRRRMLFGGEESSNDTTAQIYKADYILAWNNSPGYIYEYSQENGGITIIYNMDSPTTVLYPAGVIPYVSQIFASSKGEIQILNDGVHVNYVDIAGRWVKSYNPNHTYTEYKRSWNVQSYNQIRFTVDIRAIDDAYMYHYPTGQIWFAGINTPYYGKRYITDP